MKTIAIELDFWSGVRDPDPFHPEEWAAVCVELAGSDQEGVIMEARDACRFGAELFKGAAKRPDALFRPEIMALPENGGITAESASAIGLRMIASGIKAACKLAVWRALGKRGWTDVDKDRFLSDVSEAIRESATADI